MSVWRNDDYENINEYVNKRYFKQAHFKGGGKSTGKTILTLGLAAVGFWNPQLFGVGLAGSVSWSAAIMGAALGSNIWAATHKYTPSYSQSYNFDVLQNTIDSKARIPIIYGRRKWGGYQTWHNTSDDKQSLTKDIVLCEGEIDGIEDIRANDLSMDSTVKIYDNSTSSFTMLAAAITGFQTNKKAGDTYEKDGYTWTLEEVDGQLKGYRYDSDCPNCHTDIHTGSPTQSPPDNYSTVGGYKNVAWLRAYLTVSDKLTGSNPTITCIVRGRKVYDPRNGQTVYSTNPALCVRDYLLNKRFGTGRWINESMLNEDAIIECANYCDEIISWYVPGTLASYDAIQQQIDYWNNYLNAHPDLSSDTRDNIQNNINSLTKSLTTVQSEPISQILVTGKRYECNIVLADQQSHIDNLEQIMVTFGGFLVFNGEQISLRMEKETDVSYAFNDSNICANNGAPDIKWNTSALSDAPNQYNVTFYDPENNWTGVTFEHNDLADQKLRGRIIPKDVTLSGITSMSQAIRLARIFMAKNRLCPLKCTFSTATHAMNLEPGDIITITHGGLSDFPMRILSITESNGKYTLTCQQYNASIYDDKTGNITVKKYYGVPNGFSTPATITGVIAYTNTDNEILIEHDASTDGYFKEYRYYVEEVET